MQKYDLFGKIAKGEVIERFLSTDFLERTIEEYAMRKGIWAIAKRDTDVAMDMLREGLEKGIMSYLKRIGDANATPPNERLINHLSKRSEFAEYLFDTICRDDFIEESSLSASSVSYINGLLQISELSDFVAGTFYGYVQANHGFRSNRIF